MNDLPVGIGIATDCDSFFPCNDLHRERTNRSQSVYARIGWDKIRRCLDEKERHIRESSVRLSDANPELWSRIERAREELRKSGE